MTQSRATTPRVSVCMATWNGERWVAEQLRSILDQLDAADEVIVVDDASTDSTAAAVRAMNDPRIRLFARSENHGYVRTFAEALSRAKGRFLLLADQDDVWLPGRVAAMTAALESSDVVASNLGTLDGPDAIRGPFGQADWRLRYRDSGHRVRNVLGILAGNMPYYGCAMGVRREALGRGLVPFPEFLHESHDLWIALYGNVTGSITHLGRRTVARRFHESNQTPNRPRGVLIALQSRILLVRCVFEILRRSRRRG